MEPIVFQFLALPIFVGLVGAAGVALCRPVLAARLGALIAVVCFIAYAAMARQVSVESSLVMPFWAIPSLNIGPVTVLCRSFDHLLCSKGDEPWVQAGRMNFAKKRCE
jgi:hypothetical protein